MSTAKKVLAFDSWTVGYHNYERLVPAFRAAGIDMWLLHLGSWGDDAGRPAEEMLGQLPVRSIDYYKGESFASILDREQPDVVLFLSSRSFAHRAFLRYCRVRGIPTVNLYHGVLRVQAVDTDASAYKTSWLGQIRFATDRLDKFVKYTLAVYARSLIETRASLRDWQRFAGDLVRRAIGDTDHIAADDARTTKFCVYTAADVRHAIRTYRVTADDIAVVGNPDLIRFGLTDSMLGEQLAVPPQSREVIYLDTALPTTGWHFRNIAEFVRHLVDTRDRLAEQGYTFAAKLHPALVAAGFDRLIRDAGIATVETEELTARLRASCACIVETTTLALVPALMGMPMLLANYGQLADLRFGEILLSYPRGRLLTAVEKFADTLSELENIDRDDVHAWISTNSGPLPPELMPERVAQIVLHLADQKRPCAESQG